MCSYILIGNESKSDSLSYEQQEHCYDIIREAGNICEYVWENDPGVAGEEIARWLRVVEERFSSVASNQQTARGVEELCGD